jgi:HK97 family phage major capsid protein
MLTKEAKLQKLVADAKALRNTLEERQEAGGDVTQEERNNLQAMIDDGTKLKAQIEQEAKLDEMDTWINAPAHERRSKLGAEAPQRAKSWGTMVVESKEFEFASENGRGMAPVMVKDIHGLAEAAGGALVEAMRDPELGMIAQRPRSVLDLITVAQTNSNSVQYARQLARTNAAAPKLDYDSGWVSNITFELKTAPVETIPTYVEAHRHILADAPQLRSLIDSELTYMVRKVLEDQIVSGNGTSPQFDGLTHVSGIQTRTQGATGDRGGETTDTKADALRRAITDIQLAFYEVDGVLINPGDAEDLELAKDANGNYLNIYDPVALRLWRVPVVESSVMTAGTALVGNFRMGATLWDRQQTEIRVGEPGSMFLQNAVAILAELRAAFGVKRPTAFEKVTFA